MKTIIFITHLIALRKYKSILSVVSVRIYTFILKHEGSI
jgi:hypothetical protein